MARPLKLDKTVPIRFDSDQLERATAVLDPSENLSGLVRDSLSKEIRRRERQRQRQAKVSTEQE